MTSKRVDELLARLAQEPIDRVLEDLDAGIWRSILLLQREARTTSALAPVRVAAVGFALAMGVAAGSAVAIGTFVASPGNGVFSSAGHLSPSTLLEGAR